MADNLMINTLLEELGKYIESIESEPDKIAAINHIRAYLSQYSPFRDEPVDCIQWIPSLSLKPNDYNPNTMATPEKTLLKMSLLQDGFTQPIVISKLTDKLQIVDGYHRYLLSHSKPLCKRFKGYLPVATLNENIHVQTQSVASTIRHNRARGKHQISAMSALVQELFRQGWPDTRISNELGMDADEVLRLKQIGGIAALFKDESFSEAWTVR